MRLLDIAREVIRVAPNVIAHLSPRTRFYLVALKGGEGSGNFGHAGRPGEVGGSAPSGGGGSSNREVINNLAKNAGVNVFYSDKDSEVSSQLNENITGKRFASYNPENKTITIYPHGLSQDLETLEGVFNHEVGHYVWEDIDGQGKFLRAAADKYLGGNAWQILGSQYSDLFVNSIPNTEYSEYWKKRYLNDTSKSSAFYSEVFAETYRLNKTGQREKVPDIWNYVYDEISSSK